MMGLSDGRKNFPIGLVVLIQYRSVTDTQPATQPASHVAVAITVNAKASSLKRKKLTKNEKQLSRVSPVQYSPRMQSRKLAYINIKV